MKPASTILGGGCFWCLEAVYQRVKGVDKVISGYAGGHTANPSYEQVSSGKTGHAEVVKIDFDPQSISYEQILDIFWAIHDPTSLNRQGDDVGEQYRSIILFANQKQKAEAQKSLDNAQKVWDKPIVTEIKPLDKFYPAEEYHRDYFNNHPEAAYCQVVINPKLAKFQDQFASLLK